MIYDCFNFNDEIDLLEIRLNHHSFVDKFIIIESAKTYTGNPKPLYFEHIKSAFEKFKDKIYYIKIDFPFETNEGWKYEHLQRNILRGFTFQRDDLIIYSDCDELLKDESVLKQCTKNINHLQMDLCFYYLNLKLKEVTIKHENYHLNPCFKNKWHMAKVIKPNVLNMFENLYEIRQYQIQQPDFLIQNAGWHFSNLGSPERILNKLQSISHWGESSFQGLTIEKIKQNKKELIDPLGRDGCKYDIIPDEDLPEYIIENKDKYANYFR
jgi:beta-1,4-mannosyl-glycoprotein beta-1,4-N-acetylglucosaminyltransferase